MDEPLQPIKRPRGRPRGIGRQREIVKPTVKGRMKPEDIGFADGVMQGKTYRQAAMDAYGITKPAHASVAASRALKKAWVIKYLDDGMKGAVMKIRELSRSAQKEETQLKASQDILDRAGIGVKQGNVSAVQINFNEDREKYGNN